MLELQNIKWKVSDGTEIIKNINLEIPSGKLVVITGPNGGGKTSLAKLIAGLEEPTSGNIILDGEDITSLDELDLPDGVELTEIGNSAFKGCIDLILAELPETVTKVGRNAFSQCEKLEGVISYAPD